MFTFGHGLEAVEDTLNELLLECNSTGCTLHPSEGLVLRRRRRRTCHLTRTTSRFTLPTAARIRK
eukprot:1626740-Amphidinium_carterae.1